MKRLLLVLVILCATATPSRADDFLRNAGQSCFFGAAVLGGSAALVLYPAVANPARHRPGDQQHHLRLRPRPSRVGGGLWLRRDLRPAGSTRSAV